MAMNPRLDSELLTQAYPPVKPTFGGVLTAQRVLDGVVSGTFHPAILVVSCTLQAVLDDESYEQPTPVIGPQGAITIQVAGISESGGRYLRRFQITPYRAYRVDIKFFRSLRLDILGSTIVNGVFWAVVTKRPAAIETDEVAWFGELYSTAGRYITPPGADQVYAADPDPAFSWEQSTVAATFQTPEPLSIGAPVQVKGGAFVTSITNRHLTWRIRL